MRADSDDSQREEHLVSAAHVNAAVPAPSDPTLAAAPPPRETAEQRRPAELFDLTGRIALVTGGTRGLGRAMVLGFAQAGADVIVSSRKQDACDRVAEEITALGRQCKGYACHMARWSDIDRLVERVYDDFGRVDILVNNAGISPLYADTASVTEELWDKVLGVNLKGPFRIIALVGSRMAAGEGGSIINISSIGSLRPNKDTIPYAAAKAGLNMLTAGFADAFGPKVRVNTIMPGPFYTDISAGWDHEAFDEQRKTFPLRRAGEPAELIGAALYFASDASSFTTGATLAVDGGAQWSLPLGGDAVEKSIYLGPGARRA
jgi:NAD(P)-dependent dehydrogenase (short-subunit alcohol dehydrogenase family)